MKYNTVAIKGNELYWNKAMTLFRSKIIKELNLLQNTFQSLFLIQSIQITCVAFTQVW